MTRTASGFAAAFYNRIPAEDVAGWSAEEKGAVASAMRDWAAQRKAGAHKVRVFSPAATGKSGQVPYSAILIVNDDMPFIIDSVTAELSASNLTVDALLHPILPIRRDRKGALVEAGGKEGSAESLVYIKLEQLLSDISALALEKRLDAVLADVRAATKDWKAMLARAEAARRGLAFGKGNAEELREAEDFLRYLHGGNFTFLGCAEYKFDKTSSRLVPDSRFGVLRRHTAHGFGQGAGSPEIAALKKSASPVMIVKLIDDTAAVHRRVPMDAVAVRLHDAKGRVVGAHLFVGLFTSSTYSCRTADVPIVRRKVRSIVRKAGFASGTHDSNALSHILEKMPRDELFQVSEDALYKTARGILRLQSRPGVALFAHTDAMSRYMSCLVYVPRDRYNTTFREQAGKILEAATGGTGTNYFTTLDDSPLARVLYTIRLGAARRLDIASAEKQIAELAREWHERLKQFLVSTYGKAQGAPLAAAYGRAFTTAYHETVSIKSAAHDIRRIEGLLKSDESVCVEFYRRKETPEGQARLKVYHKDTPVPLSDILPVLENMGLRSLSETPYGVHPQGTEAVWLHDFVLEGAAGVDIEKVKANFEETFLRVWSGEAENDGLNRLVLRGNLGWREVLVLRTYNRFMRQEKFPFSGAYIEQVLGLYPKIARALVDLFLDRHDPALKKPIEKRGKALSAKIAAMLQDVSRADHDRILRGVKTLIENTLRTNFFQKDAAGKPKSVLAVKLDSKNIADLPLPRPHVEIFVYSTRVEAVHLRGGEIARGGIRWSDRHDDFRTEILGLMKSQMVKNTVIVPVGAKGGFVVKQPPKNGNREAYQQEGIACYKIFIQALLDITDNNVKGKIVRPKDVVFHDGIDTYLVVAADKGTATFSNIANELSLKAGFWLGDAFASGGSTGYDHKEIGITARGGWESVKRHFRELGKDIQAEPFTAVGVGDMAGDVFGNGVLLSKQMKLVGAFNHIHIFCDPEPDMAKSFAERARMFKARLGWDGYDKSKLSAGGAIFERSAKTVKLTPQIKKAFGLTADTVPPDELIRAILKAQVELIWFGGIGTFIKSSSQSNADADDKSNDALRVDATDIRAKVIGEGANLGTTQLARVEYARHGGRINTDFVDNSGGVDCSDHEVNIKILLADVVERRKLTTPERNRLMKKMTEDVSALVLRDNYQQTQSLSLMHYKAREHLARHADFIRELERARLINRRLEGLPDDEAIARRARDGQGLTRPELAILLAYAKMTLYNTIMASSVPDDPSLEGLLFDYFPPVLHKYAAEIRGHKLRRGLIATQLVNLIVNRMGPVFVQSRARKTGVPEENVVRAFMTVSEAFGLPALFAQIEALDNKAPVDTQLAALYDVYVVVKRATTWLLRFSGGRVDVKASVEAFRPGIEALRKGAAALVPPAARAQLDADVERFVAQGLKPALAQDIAVLGLLASAGDIVMLARKSPRGDIRTAARVYFEVGEKLGLDWLRRKASAIPPANDWQARVISGLTDDFFTHQAALAGSILRKGKKASVDGWLAQHADVVEGLADYKAVKDVHVDMLSLAAQRLGQLVQKE